MLTGADKNYDVHFPGAGPPTLLVPQKPVVAGSANNSAVRGNIDRALESCDVEDIGRALHSLQDSYAHEGQPHCGGHPEGRDIFDPVTGERRPEKTTGVWDLDEEWKPFVDQVKYDKVRAAKMRRDLQSIMDEIAEECWCELCGPESGG